MKLKTLLILLHIILAKQVVYSQDLKGIWLVDKVQVGNDQMTPVSKWFKFHDNGKYESGNGWLQNMIGLWSYDKSSNEFSATNTLGIKDESGPFKVDFSEGNMIWTRVEEGMNVKIHLQKIKNIPPSYTDLLSGLWQIQDLNEVDKMADSGPLKGLDHLFIRWDRIYRATYQDKNRKTGYWHVNGHRPELTLLPHQPEAPVESWRIKVDEKELELTGISDTNKDQVKKFIRIHQFPK